ncbi:uncharacterized protein LOC124292390 [Haliotis rubra]|uniref:uncharacterized protein LOC124292390 n=1 Tax=Haliotis rubra TaxID=36100 RepID=UPI001EE6225A|nr:uncharacterized protein LOC124292390 [Haliotis rubra]
MKTKILYYREYLYSRIRCLMSLTVNKRACVYMCLPEPKKLCERNGGSSKFFEDVTNINKRCDDLSVEGNLLFVLYQYERRVEVYKLDSGEQITVLHIKRFQEHHKLVMNKLDLGSHRHTMFRERSEEPGRRSMQVVMI